MSELKIIKKKDDPICTRISLGGTDEIGFYCVYRGNLNEAVHIMRKMLTKLESMSHEPPLSPDDGKEYA